MKSQNKAIYEQIMRRVSKEIMRILNEDIQRFNTSEYQDDDYDALDHDTIDSVIYKKPENEKEEEEMFEKIQPTSQSLELAEDVIDRLENIIKPLMNVKIPKDCLNYNRSATGDFSLNGGFMIGSKFKDNWKYDHIENTHFYAMINLYYEDDQFKLKIDKECLAKVIEFCIVYKYSLNFLFSGEMDYYKSFQTYVDDRSIAGINWIFIYINNDLPYRELALRPFNWIFDEIYKVYAAYVEFVPEYIKEFENKYKKYDF